MKNNPFNRKNRHFQNKNSKKKKVKTEDPFQDLISHFLLTMSKEWSNTFYDLLTFQIPIDIVL